MPIDPRWPHGGDCSASSHGLTRASYCSDVMRSRTTSATAAKAVPHHPEGRLPRLLSPRVPRHHKRRDPRLIRRLCRRRRQCQLQSHELGGCQRSTARDERRNACPVRSEDLPGIRWDRRRFHRWTSECGSICAANRRAWIARTRCSCLRGGRPRRSRAAFSASDRVPEVGEVNEHVGDILGRRSKLERWCHGGDLLRDPVPTGTETKMRSGRWRAQAQALRRQRYEDFDW